MMRTMMTMWMWIRTIRMRTMMRMMIGRPIGYLSTARTRGALKEMDDVDDDADVDEDDEDEDNEEGGSRLKQQVGLV